jgi:uncharacterized protein
MSTSVLATHDSTDNETGPSVQQHHLGWSILLHLLPGAALTGFIVLAAPIVRDLGLPVVFALFVGIGLVIVPIELGIMLAHARRTTGTFRLHETVVYRERLPARSLIPIVVGSFVWFTAFLLLATLVLDDWIASRFFAWMPEQILQFSQVAEAGEPIATWALVTLLIVAFTLNGLVGPLVEELYFRGFLLPRLGRFGRMAPVLNTVLFSVYHFWTPWQNLTRIIGFLPISWAAWRYHSTHVSVIAHVTINTAFLLGLLALFVGESP